MTESSAVRRDARELTPGAGTQTDGPQSWADQFGLGEFHRPDGQRVPPTTTAMKPDGMADQDLSWVIDRHPRQVEGPSR
jgi:hypothetical protein